MADRVLVVNATRDPEAGVWFVESSDVPGLNLEAGSVEELAELLPGALADLLEAAGAFDGEGYDVELLAHARTRGRAPGA